MPVQVPVHAIELVPEARRPWVGTDEGLRRLFRDLESGPVQPPTLGQVARVSVEAVRTLERRFREVTGRSYREFLKEWRLVIAWMVLREGALEPREAMAAVGRRSRSSFTRDFRKRFSATPKEVYDHARGRKRRKRGCEEEFFRQLRILRPLSNPVRGKELKES